MISWVVCPTISFKAYSSIPDFLPLVIKVILGSCGRCLGLSFSCSITFIKSKNLLQNHSAHVCSINLRGFLGKWKRKLMILIKLQSCIISGDRRTIWHCMSIRLGPSVIIGLEKIREYQWFAGRQQEVFIRLHLKVI